MFGKRIKKESFDREMLAPVIMASICTGEKTAGFMDKKTRHFTGVMVIQSERDMGEFLEKYGIKREEVETIY